MQTDDIATERADLLGWSTPLISDCLALAYRSCLGQNEKLIDHFLQQHRRLWLSLFSNNTAKAHEARKTLRTLARMCQLHEDAIQAIDDLVMDELTDVVSLRFQGSPAKTRCYSRLLIDAASALTQTRFAAA